MTLEKIISGGQTGVDRGALDAALKEGFPCGGWCPKGRLAEDGSVSLRYPLIELESRLYRDRTEKNIKESDGTIIITDNSKLSAGSSLTRQLCLHNFKRCEVVVIPYICVGLDTDEALRLAASKIEDFIRKYQIKVLNIAGPRESKWVGGANRAERIMRLLLQNL